MVVFSERLATPASAVATTVVVAATAAIAAAVTAATAAIAAAVTAATAATTAVAALTPLLGFGFVDHEGPAIQFGVVEGGNGALGVFFVDHFNKAEAFGAARVAISHDANGFYLTNLREEIFQSLLSGIIGQTANIQSLTHNENRFLSYNERLKQYQHTEPDFVEEVRL